MSVTNAVAPMVSLSHSGSPGNIISNMWQVFLNEPVVSTNEVDSLFTTGSPGIDLSEFGVFGFYTILTGTGPDVLVRVRQSYNNVAANFAYPDVNATIINVVDTTVHIIAVSPTPMPFIRFRATGQNANGADVKISAWAWFRTF